MVVKIIYKLVHGSLIAYAVLLTLYIILPIEFSNADLKEITFRVIWFTGPILFMLTLLKLAINKKTKSEVIVQIISTVVTSVAIFVFLGIYWFCAIMSGYIQDKILFEKKNSNQKILVRHHDVGGAYNSDMPKYEINKIIPLTKYFQLGIKTDTTNIDKNDWTRIAN
jgi:hypothetical protein